MLDAGMSQAIWEHWPTLFASDDMTLGYRANKFPGVYEYWVVEHVREVRHISGLGLANH